MCVGRSLPLPTIHISIYSLQNIKVFIIKIINPENFKSLNLAKVSLEKYVAITKTTLGTDEKHETVV